MTTVAAALLLLPTSVTLRFHPDLTKSYRVELKVHWEKSKRASTLVMNLRPSADAQGVVTTHLRLLGAEVGGRNLDRELAASMDSNRVDMGWTNLAQRSGSMSQMRIKELHRDLVPLISEAGLYLCEFPRRAISVGDTWTGSTTASGGCTTGTYHLKRLSEEKGRKIALIEVDKIALLSGELTKAMEFTVDVATGIPLSMTYQMSDPAKGGLVSFGQTLVEQR